MFPFSLPGLMNAIRPALLLLVLTVLPGCGGEPDYSQGEAIVKANCKVCHAQGINGAPVLGNHKMWGPRANQGIEVLVKHATEGFGLMPARGGRPQLTDEEIREAIRYMLSLVQPEDSPE